VDATVKDKERAIARNGGLGPHGEVDPWAHFLNVFMLDKDGNRIDRRNPQDIFTPLYNHQVPPGAGQVVHYALNVPENQRLPVTIRVELKYRKFDTIYMNYVYGVGYTNGMPFQVTNDLPVVTMASDEVTLPVELEGGTSGFEGLSAQTNSIPEWQRWNDYGIGLLLEGDQGSEKGELVQAAEAFERVAQLGRVDGPLNLARVYYKEGRLREAAAALQRAARFEPAPNRWTLSWLSGLVNKASGNLDKAIQDYRSILEDRYPALDQRRFDFSKDYEVINELAQTYFERAKQDRQNPARYRDFLELARQQFYRTLDLDSENLAAHYNLSLIQAAMGDAPKADYHRRMHEKYRPDDNARDRAISIQRRRNPAADHASQAITIYPLKREPIAVSEFLNLQNAPLKTSDASNSPRGAEGRN
jgi:tetratricopeptide (TPR) repeat protein